MTLPRIGADAELNLDKWSSNIQKMLTDATQVDAALNDLVQSANKAEAALNTIGGDSLNMAVVVDDSDLINAISLRELLEDPTSFVASVSDAEILAAIDLQDELDENTSFDAGVMTAEIEAASRMQADLNENTNFRANVNDGELDSAIRKHNDLDSNTSVTVNVVDDELQDALDSINAKHTLQIALDVGGGLLGAAGDVGGGLLDLTGIPGIFEMDDLLGNIEGTTGRIIPNLDEIINQLYSEAWGESRTEIGLMVAEAARLNISYENLETATRNAFALSDILGEEPEIILRAMDRMVDEGIAKDMNEAADLITTTFQNGGNAGLDMMDTIVEYTPDFAALGMTGEQAGAALVGGMEAGLMNADLVGDSLKEFNIQLNDWARDKESQPLFEELNLWDQTVAYTAGEMGFSEYMTAVQDALNALPEDQRSAAFIELFGAPSEGMADDYNTFFDAMLAGFDEEWEGSMAKASAAVEGDLGTSFTSLRRFVETEFADLLNNALDVDELIADFRERFGVFMGELTSGATLGDATETAFGGTVFAGIINGIEAVEESFMDMIIGLLQAVESVVSMMPGGDASGLQETIRELAEFQLEGIDLFTSSGLEETTQDLKTALQRGVDEAKIQDMFLQQIDTLIQGGQMGDAMQHLFTHGSAFLDDETLAGMVEQIRAIGGEAFTAAIAEADFQAAFDAATSPVEFTTLSNALAESFETGTMDAEQILTTWNVAEQIAGSEGFQGVFNTLPEQADQMLAFLNQTFGAAIDSGDLDMAQRIADTTNIPAFQSTIDDLIAAAESSEQPIDDTLQTSEDNTEDFATAVDEAATDVDTSSVHVKNAYDTMGVASGNAKKNVKANTDAMADDVETAATDITTYGDDIETAFDDIGTAAAELEKHMSMVNASMLKDFDLLIDSTNIYKMTAIEAFRTAGDEYSLLSGRIAIDTESILSSLELTAMQIADLGNMQVSIPIAGGGNTTNNNTSISNTVNNTINANSQAAAVAYANTASQIRGH